MSNELIDVMIKCHDKSDESNIFTKFISSLRKTDMISRKKLLQRFTETINSRLKEELMPFAVFCMATNHAFFIPSKKGYEWIKKKNSGCLNSSMKLYACDLSYHHILTRDKIFKLAEVKVNPNMGETDPSKYTPERNEIVISKPDFIVKDVIDYYSGSERKYIGIRHDNTMILIDKKEGVISDSLHACRVIEMLAEDNNTSRESVCNTVLKILDKTEKDEVQTKYGLVKSNPISSDSRGVLYLIGTNETTRFFNVKHDGILMANFDRFKLYRLNELFIVHEYDDSKTRLIFDLTADQSKFDFKCKYCNNKLNVKNKERPNELTCKNCNSEAYIRQDGSLVHNNEMIKTGRDVSKKCHACCDGFEMPNRRIKCIRCGGLGYIA